MQRLLCQEAQNHHLDHLRSLVPRIEVLRRTDGFLRTIDPKLHEEEIGGCVGKTQGDGIAIPIMVTGLGDLIAWEPSVGGVGILYREGRTVGLNSSVDNFLFMVDLDGPDELSDTLHWDLFPEAVATHGDLPYEQSFVVVPLLSPGGTVTVEKLHKRETVASIQVAVDLQGVIGH